MVVEILSVLVDFLRATEGDTELSLLGKIQDTTNQIESDIVRALSACMIAGYKKPNNYYGAAVVYTPQYIKETRIVLENLRYSIQNDGLTGGEGDLTQIEDKDPDTADPDGMKVKSGIDNMVEAAIKGDIKKGDGRVEWN